MRIGIVIPAYNVALYIGDTIRSLLDQTHRDWTTVVVDDGSSDDTAAVVRGFRDPRLSLVSQDNAGVSAARNRGAAGLDCEAMLFLDGDARLAPFALKALAETLADAPDAVAAVGAYERGGRVFPPASGCLLAQLPVRNPFANGGHVLIRRHAVQRFREDLRYGEDWEFLMRLALSAPSSSMAPCRDSRPLLHVLERSGGAYFGMATDPASYVSCLDAIHGNAGLSALFSPKQRSVLRRRAEAEMQWTVGRELIRHRRYCDGLRWLGRSLATVPNLRRVLLLAAIAVLPPRWRGPLRPYAPKIVLAPAPIRAAGSLHRRQAPINRPEAPSPRPDRSLGSAPRWRRS